MGKRDTAMHVASYEVEQTMSMLFEQSKKIRNFKESKSVKD